ncbi:MAG TPA: metallophosphoesterase, partial [Phycisphaerales bacterium]|nr:metallophosphoesterase [Phycisphaerales bacterium]
SHCMTPRSDHHASGKGKHATGARAGGRGNAGQTKRGKTSGKFKRARIRHFLFTVGPDRLMRGRIRRRHMSQDIVPREIEISSPRWPSAFDGMRIAHVSDFHLGDLLPLDRALAIIEQIGMLEPDMIACTGDVVDLHHFEAGPLLKAMADVAPPMGTALVLGNHDELHCGETVARLGEEAGVSVLRNDCLTINHNGQVLNIAGVHWAKTIRACAKNVDVTCPPPAACDLLLSHNPKSFHRAAERNIPLTLAGHTHGGQIAMKNRPHIGLAAGNRLRAGLYTEGDSRLFVTTGVGAWFPLRVNVPAEIAMITMRRQ